ncbi:MAG: hypothetical protein M1820_001713 [Bogoriella megaspora]|nr:MAG: hypothetical protein M1820_001713 [Bogoriella megaspora]
MRHAVAAAVLLTGYVFASPAPAPQLPDFNLVFDAPSPTALGPPPVGIAQTSVFDSASAISAATADVTTVVSAETTGSANLKRNYRGVNTAPTSAPAAISTSSSTTSAATTPASASAPSSPPCAPQPDGYGPANLTVEEFQTDREFSNDALNAPTPKGYVNTFKNLNASVNANSYLGYYNLKSYDTNLCAQHCDNTTLCTAFDIYVERDPSVDPTPGVCPNPDAITNYRCALWGSGVEAAAAVNYGQYRDQFQVVIAGSNGYEKTNTTTPAPCPGWTPPTSCPGAISGAPWNIGSNFFPGPFDPALCAAYAKQQTAYNKAHADKGTGKYSPANMFNAYMMKKNGIAQGTFCTLFTTILDGKFGSYPGGWVGNNFFGIETSFIYSLVNQDRGSIH